MNGIQAYASHQAYSRIATKPADGIENKAATTRSPTSVEEDSVTISPEAYSAALEAGTDTTPNSSPITGPLQSLETAADTTPSPPPPGPITIDIPTDETDS